jgi:ribonucleoside-diphosphate reductase alpha chain
MKSEVKALNKKIHPERIVEPIPFEEALEASVKYFGGDSLAANVWLQKYALKDSAGEIFERTPDDLHWRLATEIARVEKNYMNPIPADKIFNLLKDFKYLIPQGGPMSGIGNPFQVSSLSNCFVIGNMADSYGGIIKLDEEQAQLMKRRGGVGHDLSHIRPKGSAVKNSALSSTGIVPFMERYSNSTREVAQDGRRGALMLSISIKHPDSEDFIDAKLEQGKITGANVSVRLDNDFMKAALEDRPYIQQYPVESKNPIVTKEVDARRIWNKIVKNAWKSAEPGVLFWDTVIRESIPDCYAEYGYKTISTNPCGEIPLCTYDSCRLLAINLYSYVENPFTDKASFNHTLFQEHVRLAQRIMDDIIDLEVEKIDHILEKVANDPEEKEIKATELRLWEKIRKKCIEGRRMGLGITAEGDMLAGLNLKYGSDEAIAFAVKVQKSLAVNAYAASVDLAIERGAFEIYDSELEKSNPFIQRLAEANPNLYDQMKLYGRRNIALLTIAPTGTTSLMSQTTSGIEPVFQVSYKRRRKVNPNDKSVKVTFIDDSGDQWEEYHVLHHKFADWLELNGYSPDQVRHLQEEELKELVSKSPYFNATANDIDWVQKVKMQGAIQKWVDHSISVTVNIPKGTSVDMVGNIYQTAWESGCKGITVYREGSRSGVLISDSKKKQENKDASFTETHSPRRPKKLEAEVIRFQNDHEKWIAVVGLLEGKPYEVFTGKAEDTFVLPKSVSKGWVTKEKNGGFKNRYDFQYLDKDGYNVKYEGLSRSFDKEYWNYAKLISGVLRHGMPLPYVVDLVSGLDLGSKHINTWKNGVVRALKQFIPDGTNATIKSCNNCGDPEGLVYKEGCLICKSCGYSKCD